MLKSSAELLVLKSAVHARALPEAISNLRVLFCKLVPTLLPGSRKLSLVLFFLQLAMPLYFPIMLA